MKTELTLFEDNDTRPDERNNGIIELPVISLWQPWASWIIEGWKLIETRTHNKFAWMLHQTIAIHACKKWDDQAIELAKPYLTFEQIMKTYEFKNISGLIIGKAFVSHYGLLKSWHSKMALIDCYGTSRYGLFLQNIKRTKPLPFKGAQHQLFIKSSQLIEVFTRDNLNEKL